MILGVTQARVQHLQYIAYDKIQEWLKKNEFSVMHNMYTSILLVKIVIFLEMNLDTLKCLIKYIEDQWIL